MIQYVRNIGLCLVFVAVGCGVRSIHNTPELTLDAQYPSRVGETTPSGIQLGGILRLNESASPRSLDPVRTGETSSHHICMQIFDTLLEFDNDLNLHPCLAESYTISEDGKTYTFALRRGVYFHNDPCFPDGKGREMTADDVKYSLSRVVNPHARSTGNFIFEDIVVGARDFLQGNAEEVSGFQVVDDYTFRIQLNQRFSPFPYRVAMTFALIHPHEAVDYYGEDFFQHPVGTGAFDFVHWKHGQEVFMVRNPRYWKKDKDGIQLPYLDGVRFTFLKDYKTELLELDLGGLDVITSIHEDFWTLVFGADGKMNPEYAHYQLQAQSLLEIQYYGFNLEKEPFKGNKKLRQAINYAIDRDSIIQYVLQGRGTPAKGIVPEGMPGYTTTVEGYTYDAAKAKSLLAEAGYPDGNGLPEIILDLNSGGTTNESIAEAVQDQLAQVGIKIRLRIVEWPQHLENMDNGVVTFFRTGWIADYPDPENFLSLAWSGNFAPIGPNYCRYKNEDVDRLYEASLAIDDVNERYALYQPCEEMIMEDAPALFLFYRKRHRLVQPFVHNLELNAQEVPILHQTWVSYELPTKTNQ
jgi:oligopeptide transport system substrate-binding protein